MDANAHEGRSTVTTKVTTLWLFLTAPFWASGAVQAEDAPLATIAIKEPLGINWHGEWLTRSVNLRSGAHLTDLVLVGEDGLSVPAQFSGDPAAEEDKGGREVTILFRADLKRNATAAFRVLRRTSRTRVQWRPLAVEQSGTRTVVINRFYRVVLDSSAPLPVNGLGAPDATASLGRFAWPAGVEVTGVEDRWLEKGPIRAVVRRVFTFREDLHRYEVTFDFRAEDPWIGAVDRYALGEGTAITVDLKALRADRVYHPHTYNARDFSSRGQIEDLTLQPPQHPIATLGPVWRDIWFGGGPFAYIYRAPKVEIPPGASKKEIRERERKAEENAESVGIGFAAVRGSQWDTPGSITPESQNLEVHGDRKREGLVFVRLPTDGGTRHWAIIVVGPSLRRSIGGMIRSHADTPLAKVVRDWVLDWESDHPAHSFGLAGQWLSYFNQHQLNPTTFPRRVRVPESPVKSRDLAVLAYQFMNPDYWPGPKYKWRIGNPNFHTDMYSVPLKIGLAMPDHPHAGRWVKFGVDETKGNLMRDSFPGGAWAESLSYSKYFFHVAEYAKKLQDSGVANPLEDWRRLKEVATYLACMHTPEDRRYGSRQIAPIGDTSPGNYVRQLRTVADYYRGIDDAFACKLASFPRGGGNTLDISSREFYGFGAMLRGSPYDSKHESFVTVKAGPARNHYQGDELSFYFASLSTPLAIDYACHYSPRPWSASMHNRPDINGQRPVSVARRRAFKRSDVADVFVADERARLINEVPMEPHHTVKPGWNYPWRNLSPEKPWTMRRYVMLVKHDPRRSAIADYLVIRDEIESPEVPWWNLHLLARRIERDGGNGQVFRFPGQLAVDVDVHFVAPAVKVFEDREWGWASGSSASRRGAKGKEYEAHNFGRWIPEGLDPGTWKGGEMAKWLRVRGSAGRSDWLVVLLPRRRGQAAPEVEKLSETSFRVTAGRESEVLHLGSVGVYQAAVERSGQVTTLLGAGEVPPWSKVEFTHVPHRTERAGQKD